MDRNQQLWDRFEAEYLAVNSISEGRRSETHRTLRWLSESCGKDWDQFEASDINAYMGKRRDSGISVRTIGKELVMIRAFCSWMFSAEVIDVGKIFRIREVQPPRGARAPSVPRPYTRTDIRELYSKMAVRFPVITNRGEGSRMLKRYLKGSRDFDWKLSRYARRLQYDAQISLALECGLRRGEIYNLTIPRMDPMNDGVVVITAKGMPDQEKEREIPYTEHARETIGEWVGFRRTLPLSHQHPWLLLHGCGRLEPQGETIFGTSLSAFGQDRKGENWQWHRLRHTFATERLRSGMKLEKVSLLMGHSNISQTLQYVQILKKDISEDIETTQDDFEKQLGFAA